MKRSILAVTLGLVMMTTFMPASAEPEAQGQVSTPTQVQVKAPDPTKAPDPAPKAAPAESAAPVTGAPATEKPAGQATDKLVEQPVTEAPTAAATEQPFTAKVRIELQNKGQLYFGDKVTLRAIVEKASAKYTVVWEYYNVDADVKKGENPWVAVEKGDKYVFTASEKNVSLTYRVVVNGVVVSDTYKLPKVEVKPEEEADETVSEPEEGTEPEVEDEVETDPEDETEPEVEDETVTEPEEETETDPEDETDPEVEDETEEEPEDETGEEPEVEDETEEAAEPERSVEIRAEWEGDELHFGDVCTLVAELSGYEGTDYSLQWQVSEDDSNWTDVEGATEATYEMIVTEENYQNFWRVTVTATADAE